MHDDDFRWSPLARAASLRMTPSSSSRPHGDPLIRRLLVRATEDARPTTARGSARRTEGDALPRFPFSIRKRR